MGALDAVIVGARCAGSTLAILLAQQGWDVLLVDRRALPSETLCTHLLYPNTLARLQQLGVLDRLLADHELPMLGSRIVGLGHEISGDFTPIEGFDRAAAPRRSVLDKAILDTALAAGAGARFGERVVGLIGSGTDADPVAGVTLANGERISARWVFGADGRASTVARVLGVPKENVMRGEVSMLLAHWRGIPNDGYATLDIRERTTLTSWAVEDGHHLLTVAGDAAFTKGSREGRRASYLGALRGFPETLDLAVLDRAEMVSPVRVAPESLMRGFYRRPSGPGWALLGDACHFKHPGSSQGIADAVEEAVYVADAVTCKSPHLDRYQAWLEERTREHYPWSFKWGRFPRPESAHVFRGWMSEPDAAQDLRDSFSRLVSPRRATGVERLMRWASTRSGRPRSGIHSGSGPGERGAFRLIDEGLEDGR